MQTEGTTVATVLSRPCHWSRQRRRRYEMSISPTHASRLASRLLAPLATLSTTRAPLLSSPGIGSVCPVRTPVSPTYVNLARATATSPTSGGQIGQQNYDVVRLDDKSHEFVISTHGAYEDACEEAQAFEARGHRQTFFVRGGTVADDASVATHSQRQISGAMGMRPGAGPASTSPRRLFSTSAAAAVNSSTGQLPLAATLDRSASSAGWDPAFSAEDNAFILQQTQPGAAFALAPSFVARYANERPPFGYNGLGEFVFVTRYARLLPDGARETWCQTVERVVAGTFNMQRRWIEGQGLGWNPWRAQRSARAMYERIFTMKFLPPGRGLWAMGTPVTEQLGLYAALNNCAFVSTENLADDPARPFAFLMDASMLGVGVGFDTDGAGTVTVRGPTAPDPLESVPVHSIGDSREGWVESVTLLLRSYFDGTPRPTFDYSRIRPRGSPIRGFGGVASGPEVLQVLHGDIEDILRPLAGRPISVTGIVDLMNAIGRCIVSGDVRQTAEIAFGPPDSDEYIDLKDYTKNPGRAAWGWCSNNSIYARLGMDYAPVARRVARNGEPGFAWLDNMRRYGRMGDPPNDKDARVKGGNPCLEQSLESYELCCLVEVFPNNHASVEDFKETLKCAYLYAKTVTLGGTHWPATNRVMLRNRRIGTSLSGLSQFIASRGLAQLHAWCTEGYAALQDLDARLSEWLAVPRSVKTTCVKPSGTVSLLAGATPGVHAPESRFYLRRVRVGTTNPVLHPLRQAGYHVEPAVEDPARKCVVTFPVDAGAGVRTLDGMSMWEQLSLAAFMQRHWADNQVSCTVTFDPATEGPQIPAALDLFQYQLKGVSFLPRAPKAVYAQLPYEAVSEEEYRAAVAGLKPLRLEHALAASASSASSPAVLVEPLTEQAHAGGPDRFCDSSACDPDLMRPAVAAPADARATGYCSSPAPGV